MKMQCKIINPMQSVLKNSYVKQKKKYFFTKIGENIYIYIYIYIYIFMAFVTSGVSNQNE